MGDKLDLMKIERLQAENADLLAEVERLRGLIRWMVSVCKKARESAVSSMAYGLVNDVIVGAEENIGE